MKLVNDITHAMVLDKAREHLDRDDQRSWMTESSERRLRAEGRGKRL
jgi:hypothetical protein